MDWIKKSTAWIIEKLNPAQSVISTDYGTSVGTDSVTTYKTAFDTLESVNRGVSLLVNSCSGLDYDIKDKLKNPVVPNIRPDDLSNLLNFRPNPYQNQQDFRKNIYSDFVLEGNAFVYFDGKFIYHLPAANVEILTDEKTFIKGYMYNGFIEFKETEVFSFKDISSTSIYRGTSRLSSAKNSIKALTSMQSLQTNFYDNGAIFGLILTSDNALSEVAKERTINKWVQKYNPKLGGKRPVILDNGLKPHAVTQSNFKDMDFDATVASNNNRILNALGVPPILLEGGNNANISPNLRLFYLETVLPINRAYISALERFFGYDIEAVTNSISALQPDIKDTASYMTTLVNGGIISANEARVELRREPIAGHDDLRIPANIAGSAVDPSIGGRPEDDNKE